MATSKKEGAAGGSAEVIGRKRASGSQRGAWRELHGPGGDARGSFWGVDPVRFEKWGGKFRAENFLVALYAIFSGTSQVA